LKPVGAVLGFQGFWASFPGYVSPHEVWHYSLLDKMPPHL
jgi:hypothetical protein